MIPQVPPSDAQSIYNTATTKRNSNTSTSNPNQSSVQLLSPASASSPSSSSFSTRGGITATPSYPAANYGSNTAYTHHHHASNGQPAAYYPDIGEQSAVESKLATANWYMAAAMVQSLPSNFLGYSSTAEVDLTPVAASTAPPNSYNFPQKF